MGTLTAEQGSTAISLRDFQLVHDARIPTGKAEMPPSVECRAATVPDQKMVF